MIHTIFKFLSIRPWRGNKACLMRRGKDGLDPKSLEYWAKCWTTTTVLFASLFDRYRSIFALVSDNHHLNLSRDLSDQCCLSSPFLHILQSKEHVKSRIYPLWCHSDYYYKIAQINQQCCIMIVDKPCSLSMITPSRMSASIELFNKAICLSVHDY